MLLALIVAILSAALLAPVSFADEPAVVPQPIPGPVVAAPSKQQVAPSPVATQYVIKCQLYAAADKASQKPLAAPSMVVNEGQEGCISIEGQIPFVTGIRAGEDDSPKPVVTLLREGTTGTVIVNSLAGDQVHVDASFSISSVRSAGKVQGPDKGTPFTQAPLLTTESWRLVRSLKLGESIDVMSTTSGTAHKVATLSVDRLGADEAAITPISATETEEPQEAYTAVYQVGDLLEEYAQNLPEDKLQDSDFVLVMDMIFTEAQAKWSEDATIRAFPKKRALVVTQTKAGHEVIARLLQDKRTHVADARKLLQK